jgi:penicillin-binding protein 1A
VLLGIWAALALAVLILACAWDLPRPEAALEAVRRPSLRLADRDGRVFATYGDLVGRKVHLADLPPALPEAVVAIEDRRFWSHWGIDVVGILRAALVNLRAGRIVQGGSTLTQQVAKNLFLSNARTFRRKVQEILLTLWLEERFSKREILEIWLNRVYLGGGAWGVDAAAQLYFGVPAARLRLWQCAVLAGLPRAPSRFNPRADPRAAAARAREVLAAMVAAGTLGPDQARDAAARIAFPPRRPGGGYFADWAAEQAEAAIPEGTDALVRTTLDPRAQAVAESALRRLLDGPGAAAGATQGAVAVLDAASGGVRALVGGRDYAASPYDRAVAARRQPGSAFKPFVWLAALEHGMHPDDAVLDAPITLDGWSPRNFDGRFRGEVTLEDALADSLNTASVRLLRAVGGPSVVAAVARRLGIADRLTLNDTLALGTSDVGVLELASAYAAFFTGGLRRPPTAIEAVTGGSLPGGGVPGGSVPGGSVPGGSVPGGSVPGGVGTAAAIAVPPAVAPIRVMSPDAAADMLRMLRAVVARGSGRAAAVPGRVVAGKTGTTQDSRDAWFVGGVDGRVIAVWIGNDDGAPMHGVTGGGLPADLFGQIARALP